MAPPEFQCSFIGVKYVSYQDYSMDNPHISNTTEEICQAGSGSVIVAVLTDIQHGFQWRM